MSDYDNQMFMFFLSFTFQLSLRLLFLETLSLGFTVRLWSSPAASLWTAHGIWEAPLSPGSVDWMLFTASTTVRTSSTVRISIMLTAPVCSFRRWQEETHHSNWTKSLFRTPACTPAPSAQTLAARRRALEWKLQVKKQHHGLMSLENHVNQFQGLRIWLNWVLMSMFCCGFQRSTLNLVCSSHC